MAGDAGPSAALSVAVESRCAAELVSRRTVCAREWLRRDVHAIPSPALVSKQPTPHPPSRAIWSPQTTKHAVKAFMSLFIHFFSDLHNVARESQVHSELTYSALYRSSAPAKPRPALYGEPEERWREPSVWNHGPSE